jgi:phospholipid transport system substrate-binding protein
MNRMEARRITMRSIVLGLMIPSLVLAASGPMATLKQLNGEVDKLLRQNPAAGSPAAQKQKADIKVLAGKLLDYQELAKRSLDSHWEKLSKAQQEDFVSTLRELIERNYVKQLQTNLDYKVLYNNEQVNGDSATVATVVKVKTQGKTTDAEIVYKLRKVGSGENGTWLVWDVITDEVSLVRNYKSQFGKIISEKSYDELIKKMKSKLTENP